MTRVITQMKRSAARSLSRRRVQGGKKTKRAKSASRGYKIGRQMGVLGTTVKTSLKFHSSGNLNVSATGDPEVIVFSANGLWDPEIALGGAQPRGFDELMNLYDHYVGIYVTADVWVTNADTGNGNIVGMVCDDDASTSLAVVDLMENNTMRCVGLSPETGGPSTQYFRYEVNPNEFLGRSKPLSDPDLKGSASGNPTEQAYLKLFVIPFPEATDTAVCYFHIVLTYTAVFLEPNQPAQS